MKYACRVSIFISILATQLFAGIADVWPNWPNTYVVPPQPDSHDAIRVVTYHVYAPESPLPVITRNLNEIRIEYRGAGGGLAFWGPVATTVSLGVLSPGDYELVMLESGKETSRTPIVVRGVDPFTTFPAGAPTTGGRVRVGDEGMFERGAKVFFGDVEATVRESESYQYLMVDAPPHAPGIVDVTVVAAARGGTQTLVARHAFKYFEPSATPEPFVFEPLLFPFAFDGPGVAGSQWRTETLLKPYYTPVLFHKPPCLGCGTTITSATRLDALSRPDGLLVHVARDGVAEMGISSRVRDVSRSRQSTGTEVPVVRVRDFRDRIVFTNVPADRGHRTMLRVWVSDALRDVHFLEAVPLLTVDSLDHGRESNIPVEVARSESGLWFGSVDLTPTIAKFPVDEVLTVSVSSVWDPAGSIWGVVTVTNNETQQVTLLAPNP